MYDEDDLFLFCSAVEESYPDVQCVKAEAANNAFLILQDERLKPDFIFLDLNMPLISGKKCLNHA